jgi:hypothetical protein
VIESSDDEDEIFDPESIWNDAQSEKSEIGGNQAVSTPHNEVIEVSDDEDEISKTVNSQAEVSALWSQYKEEIAEQQPKLTMIAEYSDPENPHNLVVSFAAIQPPPTIIRRKKQLVVTLVAPNERRLEFVEVEEEVSFDTIDFEEPKCYDREWEEQEVKNFMYDLGYVHDNFDEDY